MFFWLIYPIWFIEVHAMIGFLGVNYRGVLGDFLEAQASVIGTGWLGIGDGGRWLTRGQQNVATNWKSWGTNFGTVSNDVFLGKFTEYAISPLFTYQ